MRSKRSRTASTVAAPAAQSWRIIAPPRIGSASSVTAALGGVEPRREQRGERPGERRSSTMRDRHRDQQQRARRTRAASSRAPVADEQRRRGDADALAEDAEDRVEREGDEEAVGAAVDPEGAEVEQAWMPEAAAIAKAAAAIATPAWACLARRASLWPPVSEMWRGDSSRGCRRRARGSRWLRSCGTQRSGAHKKYVRRPFPEGDGRCGKTTLQSGLRDARSTRFGDRPALQVAVAEAHLPPAARACGRDRGDDPGARARRRARRSRRCSRRAAAPLRRRAGRRSWRGHGYVPLNPRFPAERCREMLVRAGCRRWSSTARRADRSRRCSRASDDPPARDLAATRHTVTAPRVAPPALQPGDASHPTRSPTCCSPPAAPAAEGRDGRAPQRRARSSTSWSSATRSTSDDRFSQTFDLTFDLSVFDMFVAWERGACLCCPSRGELMAPARFIRDARADGLVLGALDRRAS